MSKQQFNWETKEVYLEQLPENRRKSTSSFLKRLDAIEAMYNIDVYNAEAKTVSAILDEYLTYNRSTNISALFTARDYVDWAIKTGVSYQTENHAVVYQLKFNYLQSFIKYFFSFYDLDDYLSSILRDDALETVDIFHKNYIELLYLGLTSDEIIDLPMTAANFQAHTLTVGRRTYHIPDPLNQRMILDAKLDQYAIERRGNIYYRRKQQGDFLLRSSGSGEREILRGTVASRLIAAKSSSENKRRPTLDSIFVSGCMDRARCREDNSEEYFKAEYLRMKKVDDLTLNHAVRDYRNWLKAQL